MCLCLSHAPLTPCIILSAEPAHKAGGAEPRTLHPATPSRDETAPQRRLRNLIDRSDRRSASRPPVSRSLRPFEDLLYMPLQLPAMNFRSHRLLRRSPPAQPALSTKPTAVGGASSTSLGNIAQISPCLYLSSGNAAGSRHLVYARNVTCIVNATLEIPNSNWPDVDYIKVPVPDLPHAPLALYFDSVADRIHQNGKRNGRTLVHCVAGVSRSATLCIAYLMKYHRLSLLDAHQWVKTRRPVVRPNAGFWQQLIQYEKKLFGKNTVRLVPSPLGLIPDIYERETRNLIPVWGFR